MNQSSPRKYETIVVLNSKLSESQLKEEVKKIEGVISTNGGQGIVVDTWGRKETTYSMNKDKYGYYVCFTYETANNQTPNGVTAILRISEPVLKFQSHLISTKKRKVKVNPKRPIPSGDSDDFDDSVEAFY